MTISVAIKNIVLRLHQCPDYEHEQNVIRIVLVLLILAYACTHGVIVSGRWLNPGNAILIYGLIGYVIFSIGIFVWIWAQPCVVHLRRVLFLLGDRAIISCLLLLSDEYIQFGYFLYLWVDIGNGARYGLVNQYISTMVSLVGFGIVIHQNSFWLSHPAVAYGLWLGILMVPLYVMVFRRRLQTANQELQAAYLEMKSLAVRDSLTGLPNRSFLYERLNQAIADARRFRRSFTVLYLDIDNFKTINDTFGHPAGDTALQKVGAILRAMTRQGDTVARMGGDEFVILLSEISIADARHIADAIRDAIGAQAGQCPMTTSIGMATYPECAEETQTLIRCADEALYAAKRRGKNKVVLYSDGPTSVESMVPE